MNDNYNLYFEQDHGPIFGDGGNLGIYMDNRLFSYCNNDPFKVPKNAYGVHEITEEG